jgi:hypothetical protein
VGPGSARQGEATAVVWMEEGGTGAPDEFLGLVAEQAREGRRGVDACPALVVARAQLVGSVGEPAPLGLRACQVHVRFLERSLQVLLALGKPRASVLKREFGTLAFSLRALKLAAEVLNAPRDQVELLLEA